MKYLVVLFLLFCSIGLVLAVFNEPVKSFEPIKMDNYSFNKPFYNESDNYWYCNIDDVTVQDGLSTD